MKKLLIILATASLFAAGCEIKREGYQFVITTQGDETVIEGQQRTWDLQPNLSNQLRVIEPGLQPSNGFVLPQ
jgi:hypothetical protein